MGLPQQPSEPRAAQPPQSSYESAHRPPTTTSSGASLPPAAIDLATKLFDFAREGKTPELAQYLSAGIPPNLTNHKGDTLLMLAAYYSHVDCVKMLLEKGADVDAINDRGQSPIAGAVFKGSDEVVRVLKEGGADLGAGQPNAVDAARMFKREECLRIFGVEG